VNYDRYITLASSSKPELTAAITGSFSGPPGVTSTFSWEIEADLLEAGSTGAQKSGSVAADLPLSQRG